MSQDKLEIQFVLFAMLRIDYKCISQLMLIRLAACVVLMRNERSEEAVLVVCAVLFVTSFIYLAAAPQAAGIWLMIMKVHIRSLSLTHTLTHSHIICDPLLLFIHSTFSMHALPNLILVRSFKLAYSPKVKKFPFFPLLALIFPTPQRSCLWRGVVEAMFVMLILYPSGNRYNTLIVIRTSRTDSKSADVRQKPAIHCMVFRATRAYLLPNTLRIIHRHGRNSVITSKQPSL